MPQGIASANQLAMMEKVLCAYCSTYGITEASEREDVAALILQMFDRGFRSEEALLAELINRRPG